MDNRLTPISQEEVLEDALRTYPVKSLPKDFTSAVMSQIRQTSSPRFRVTYVDVVLAVALTLAIAATWFGIQSLPGPAMLHLRIQGVLLWQSMLINARWLVPASIITLGTALAFCALMNLRLLHRA